MYLRSSSLTSIACALLLFIPHFQYAGDNWQSSSSYSSYSSSSSDSVAGAAIALAAGAAVAGTIWVCYKIGEAISFDNAVSRLRRNAEVSSSIGCDSKHQRDIDDASLVHDYAYNPTGYEQYYNAVNCDARTLRHMHRETKDDIYSWRGAAAPWFHNETHVRQFVSDADHFAYLNEPRVIHIENRLQSLNDRPYLPHLVKLAHLCHAEPQTKHYPLVEAAGQHRLYSDMVRSHYPTTTPCRAAWQDINNRVTQYDAALLGVNNNIQYPASTTALAYLNTGNIRKNDCVYTQRTIAALPQYTEDLRIEKEEAHRKEVEEAAKRQAAAAEKTAQAQQETAHAQQRQARAQEAQVRATHAQTHAIEQKTRQTKEEELTQLKIKLTDVERKIQSTYRPDNALFEDRKNLIERINTLERDLHIQDLTEATDATAAVLGFFLS